MEITIGKRKIGEGHPTFIIAELGYNFSTKEEALDSVDLAAEAGVDALKLQTFRADTLVTKDVDFPPEAGGGNQHAEFKRYEISEAVHKAVFERCRKRGIEPFSTPSYRDDADMLERLGCRVYKIGSDDLTNLPYMTYIAKKGKPVIFSSGMGTMSEVSDAVAALTATGNKDLMLLQCVSNYPIKDPTIVNLRVLQSFARAFPVIAGFSDHTVGVEASVAAVALGAKVVEKHFTPDKGNGAPDSPFSADPCEMKALVDAIRNVEKMLGDGVKRPTKSESDMRRWTRKSLVAKRDIPAGKVLQEGDVIIKRPATGIQPAQLALAVGRKTRRAVKADEVLGWDAL